ncbi:hypothetical protein HYV83_02370 [Candidatus Woesearchaeota archaeon]|nr:hypothetical protein [Candidatus Woesearchaeota archaeon]
MKKYLVGDLLREYFGDEVFNLIGELSKKRDYSEFKLAEALKMEVNETRNLLYRLHSLNLASFARKKDNKIGWYIYYWTFHDDLINDFLLRYKKSQLESLRERFLKEGKSDFYSCLNKCVRLDFDKACDFSFHCPECGELLGREAEGDEKRLGSEMIKINAEIGFLEGLQKKAAITQNPPATGGKSADASGNANKVKKERKDKNGNLF